MLEHKYYSKASGILAKLSVKKDVPQLLLYFRLLFVEKVDFKIYFTFK